MVFMIKHPPGSCEDSNQVLAGTQISSERSDQRQIIDN
jgi:hypothetical protein